MKSFHSKYEFIRSFFLNIRWKYSEIISIHSGHPFYEICLVNLRNLEMLVLKLLEIYYMKVRFDLGSMCNFAKLGMLLNFCPIRRYSFYIISSDKVSLKNKYWELDVQKTEKKSSWVILSGIGYSYGWSNNVLKTLRVDPDLM